MLFLTPQKNHMFTKYLLLLSFFISTFSVNAQQKEPWTANQLMDPAELVSILNGPEEEIPVILSLGAGEIIPHSKEVGTPAGKEGLQTMKTLLAQLPKDAEIVIYCGCCPFEHCPNVRPAFSLLNEMQFQNHKLLNLPENIKVDWLDKNYPVVPH